MLYDLEDNFDAQHADGYADFDVGASDARVMPEDHLPLIMLRNRQG